MSLKQSQEIHVEPLILDDLKPLSSPGTDVQSTSASIYISGLAVYILPIDKRSYACNHCLAWLKMPNFEEKLLNTQMTKKIAKENILFDFDDIQQTVCRDKIYTSPKENPHTSKNLPCINESRQPLGCRAMKVIKGLPKSLGLPQICGSSNIETKVIVRRETPWETYRLIGVREVAGQVIIAADRSRLSRMRTFREYKKADAEKLIRFFRNFNHLNILARQRALTPGGYLARKCGPPQWPHRGVP